jgi:DIE2/ALG10 family
MSEIGKNGNITLNSFSGDKEHHKPVYHLAMPLHMCVIFTAFMLPLSLGTPKFTSSLKTCASRNNDMANSSSSSISSSSRVVRKSKSDDQVGSHSHSDSSSLSSSQSESSSSSSSHSDGSSDASMSVMRFKILSVLGHLAGMVLVTYALQHHTLSHPFLLADNRYALARTLNLPCVRDSSFASCKF